MCPPFSAFFTGGTLLGAEVWILLQLLQSLQLHSQWVWGYDETSYWPSALFSRILMCRWEEGEVLWFIVLLREKLQNAFCSLTEWAYSHWSSLTFLWSLAQMLMVLLPSNFPTSGSGILSMSSSTRYLVNLGLIWNNWSRQGAAITIVCVVKKIMVYSHPRVVWNTLWKWPLCCGVLNHWGLRAPFWPQKSGELSSWHSPRS